MFVLQYLKEKDQRPTGSGNLTVIVEEGNALQSKADVLINTAGPQFQLSRMNYLKSFLKGAFA